MSEIKELISAGNFFVAEYEKKIIGCGGWIADDYEPQKAEIWGFSVHPDFARKGVATHILDKCENECLGRGIKALYLTATLAGELFYKKSGFSESHRVNHFLSNEETFALVKMIKSTLGTR